MAEPGAFVAAHALARRKAPAVAASLALLSALIALCLLTIVSSSFALRTGRAIDFSLGGNATVVHPGSASATAAQLTATGPTGESHVNIAVSPGLKLGQLTSLSTDYRFVVGSCWAGSPRFTANVTNGTGSNSVFFYIGPSNAGCGSSTYTNSGNLAAPTSLVDTSQLPGGSLSEPFSNAQSAYGNYTVTAVHIDVDGGEGGDQTVDFDNTTVNGRFVNYEPKHGISVLVERAAGTIKVKKPRKRGFKRLKKVESIPVNSVLDTRRGRVEVTAATGKFAQTTPDDSVAFYDGLIRLKQPRARNAAATAKLVGKLRCPRRAGGQAKAGKSSAPLATASRRRGRRVWGSGGGNYKTSGSGGTGSVRGTTWLTRDTCRGTFFKVTEGIGISVRDFDLGRTVKLGPGQSYFARNR
jgi:hypothetical protein